MFPVWKYDTSPKISPRPRRMSTSPVWLRENTFPVTMKIILLSSAPALSIISFSSNVCDATDSRSCWIPASMHFSSGSSSSRAPRWWIESVFSGSDEFIPKMLPFSRSRFSRCLFAIWRAMQSRVSRAVPMSNMSRTVTLPLSSFGASSLLAPNPKSVDIVSRRLNVVTTFRIALVAPSTIFEGLRRCFGDRALNVTPSPGLPSLLPSKEERARVPGPASASSTVPHRRLIGGGVTPISISPLELLLLVLVLVVLVLLSLNDPQDSTSLPGIPGVREDRFFRKDFAAGFHEAVPLLRALRSRCARPSFAPIWLSESVWEESCEDPSRDRGMPRIGFSRTISFSNLPVTLTEIMSSTAKETSPARPTRYTKSANTNIRHRRCAKSAALPRMLPPERILQNTTESQWSDSGIWNLTRRRWICWVRAYSSDDAHTSCLTDVSWMLCTFISVHIARVHM
mmetsp:Transcript_13972/g.33875  ORF Transcript_13972/g.33875 Transcript_13972/m.33875 type:complete len:455 (-) Transcript_13972:1996-3360(-)